MLAIPNEAAQQGDGGVQAGFFQNYLCHPNEGSRPRTSWKFLEKAGVLWGCRSRADGRLADNETTDRRDSDHRHDSGEVGYHHEEEHGHQPHESCASHHHRRDPSPSWRAWSEYDYPPDGVETHEEGQHHRSLFHRKHHEHHPRWRKAQWEKVATFNFPLISTSLMPFL
jgi:hypothetical protein